MDPVAPCPPSACTFAVCVTGVRVLVFQDLAAWSPELVQVALRLTFQRALMESHDNILELLVKVGSPARPKGAVSLHVLSVNWN